MNTTWLSRILLMMAVAILPAQASGAAADSLSQPPADNYAFTVEAMGGITFNTKEDNFKSKKFHLSPSFRLMWKPDHRLNIGIESTYMTVQNIDFTKNKNKISAKMEAVPVFLLFNMNVLYLDLTAGIGVSYMSSTIEVQNEESRATNWHYCFNFGLGYTLIITDNFGVGLEGKIFTLTKTDDRIASLYLKLVYNFLY